MQLLFKIVKEASEPEKLQDAKDVLDFIHYEICSQMQLSKSLQTKHADDASQKDKLSVKPNYEAQPQPKNDPLVINEAKAPVQN